MARTDARVIRFRCFPFANLIEHGKTPLLDKEEIEDLGFTLITWPLTALYTSAKSVHEALTELYNKGHTKDIMDKLMTFEKFNKMIGLEKIYLFGSYAKNNYNSKSDIDLLFFVKNNGSLRKIQRKISKSWLKKLKRIL